MHRTCAVPTILALIACSASVLPAAVSPIEAASQVRAIGLEQVVASPRAYESTAIRFRAVIVGTGELYDPLRTQFAAQTHANLLVWPERSELWTPNARAGVVTTLYIDRNLSLSTKLGEFRKYQVVEIFAKVAATNDNQPWLLVETIVPVPKSGAFTDAALYHVEEAGKLAEDPNGPARDLAEDHYAAALAENLPAWSRITVLGLRARNLMAAGQYAETSTFAQDAIKAAEADSALTDADKAKLYVLAAKAQGETKSYKEAVTHSRRALALDPSLGDAYAVLGIALAGLERYDEARRECDKAVRLRPQDAEVRWYLGRILDLQGRYDEAIEALKKAIDLTPKDYRIHKAVAAVYFHRGLKAEQSKSQAKDFDTSLREYDITIRLNPTDAEALVFSGQVIEAAAGLGLEVPVPGGASEKATIDLALTRYEAATAANPKNLLAHETLVSKYAVTKPDQALKHLKALAALQPDSLARVVAWSDYLRAQGKETDALPLLAAFWQGHPKYAEAGLALAKLQIALGLTAESITTLEAVVRLDKPPAEAGKLLDAQKDRLKAEALMPKPAAKVQVKPEAKPEASPKPEAKPEVQPAASTPAPVPAPAPAAPAPAAEPTPAPTVPAPATPAP